MPEPHVPRSIVVPSVPRSEPQVELSEKVRAAAWRLRLDLLDPDTRLQGDPYLQQEFWLDLRLLVESAGKIVEGVVTVAGRIA